MGKYQHGNWKHLRAWPRDTPHTHYEDCIDPVTDKPLFQHSRLKFIPAGVWRRIREEYIQREYSRKELSKRWGISEWAINYRMRHENWGAKRQIYRELMLSCVPVPVLGNGKMVNLAHPVEKLMPQAPQRLPKVKKNADTIGIEKMQASLVRLTAKLEAQFSQETVTQIEILRKAMQTYNATITAKYRAGRVAKRKEKQASESRTLDMSLARPIG